MGVEAMLPGGHLRQLCYANARYHDPSSLSLSLLFFLSFGLGPGNFKMGGERGTILKKLCPKEENCFQLLMQDPLRPFIPQYKGHVVADDGESKTILSIFFFFKMNFLFNVLTSDRISGTGRLTGRVQQSSRHGLQTWSAHVFGRRAGQGQAQA